MCWDELLSMEVDHGKPTLATVTALSTSHCLPLFLVLKVAKRWAKLPLCGGTLLHVVGFVPWGCPRVGVLGDLSGAVAFGEWGAWRQTLRWPCARPGTQAPPALAEDAREKNLEALLKLVLHDRAASGASDHAAAAEGASVVCLLRTYSSTVYVGCWGQNCEG